METGAAGHPLPTPLPLYISIYNIYIHIGYGYGYGRTMLLLRIPRILRIKTGNHPQADYKNHNYSDYIKGGAAWPRD